MKLQTMRKLEALRDKLLAGLSESSLGNAESFCSLANMYVGWIPRVGDDLGIWIKESGDVNWSYLIRCGWGETGKGSFNLNTDPIPAELIEVIRKVCE